MLPLERYIYKAYIYELSYNLKKHSHKSNLGFMRIKYYGKVTECIYFLDTLLSHSEQNVSINFENIITFYTCSRKMTMVLVIISCLCIIQFVIDPSQ